MQPATQPPIAQPVPLAAHALVYNELPTGSDIRREYGPGGAVTITAPAGEPSAAARRAAAYSTGISSAAVCGIGLLALLWVGSAMSPSFQRLDAELRVMAMVLFGVFCAGVFVLVWKVYYAARLDVLVELCREASILHANNQRLLVETTGPRGNRSFEVKSAEVRCVSVAGGHSSRSPVPYVNVERSDGSLLRLLPGRHPAELHWVAATVSHALRKQPS